MTSVSELIKTANVVGLRSMLRLKRAHQLAWPGMLNGFYATRVMQTLLNIGFFDELESRKSVDVNQFAQAKNFDGEVLKFLCEAMYSYGVLRRAGDGYALTEDGALLVGVGRGWFEAVYGYEGVFHELESLVRKTGRYGETITRRADFVAKGSGAIENWLYFPIAIDHINRHHYKHVLDLGCGEGTFLRHLCRSDSRVTGYGIDLAPEAIADGQQKLRAEGLEQRVNLFVLDMNELEARPPVLGKIDIGIVFFVLHELLYSGPQCVIEFLKSYKRLFPGTPLMVFEVDRPTSEEMRRRPGMAIPYYLQHDLSHQKPIRKDEWLPIFAAAGFTVREERDFAFAKSVCFTLV